MRCRICDGEIVQRYTSNYGFSVSSENRILDQNIEVYECLHCRHIQKFASPQVLDLIYQTYQSDSILPHMEQVKLELGESKSCSQAVLDHTRMYLAHSSQLAMLDYGAGGGGMLKSFLATYPQSRVYAYDVSDSNRSRFEEMEHFAGFYENLDEINGKFECITMIHVLEHILDLDEVLARLYGFLSDDGALLIQVPDVAQNLWDVFVYDHLHHFTRESLRRVCEKSGFIVYIPEQQIARQITLVAKKYPLENQNKQTQKQASEVASLESPKFEFRRLLQALSLVQESIHSGQKIYVFGSTPPSTFIGRMLGDHLGGFIDEDSRKIGKMHLDKPILSPHSCEATDCVLMPLGKSLAQAIRQKYDLNQVVEVF